jgi:hypothetical protein
MGARLAEIQWPAGSRRHVRTSRNEAASNRPASATGVRREAASRDRPAIGALVGETPATGAREAAILVRIAVAAEAETVSATAAFPVAEDPAAPVGSAAAPEGTAAVVHGAVVRAAHQAWEAPVAAGGGGES